MLSDHFYFPVDAVPHDVLGIDGADEKLENELPMAHTEQDLADCVKYIAYFSELVTVEGKTGYLARLSERRESQAEAHDDQMSLWVFY